ncbi:MAG: subclass B3 metallo-beta-lactamase [Acidobacteria bacterium]|nr:MAG: subclass B3 metallo-beta-lactamase [Acidobacteriota bacterium]REK02826.1 MAG: subclass B3 metallo-beta-lactamase [Acidobacteriota bacterium]REK13370.1 MAG: subclass B3 metallo-beta-lactamase [Acidobacteriota bacterium]REK41364.1 MAG: subclass B3 metallo-beta-lactamase [Acidobacteriota bacterium]
MNTLRHFLVAFLLIFFVSVTALAQITDDAVWEMTRPTEPFKVIANVYYVGTGDVASYLITSDEGHILIDSGFEETVPLIEASVRSLGFKLEDVRILLNNHAHFDHCGGLKTLKDKTGAKLYSVKRQAEVLKTGGASDFRFGGEQIFKPVDPDKIIEDGEVVSLGGNELATVLTPGHTKGATTWTMKVSENGQIFTVIFLSSLSNLDYDLVANEGYPEVGSDFESTFDKLLKLKPDVFLGSHAGFFRMRQKFLAMRSGADKNPFIDPEGYRAFVLRMKQDFEKKREEQRSAGKEGR